MVSPDSAIETPMKSFTSRPVAGSSSPALQVEPVRSNTNAAPLSTPYSLL
jgi:hypothetical protein